MIRITQSYLTNMLGKQLEDEGWRIMYIDFADGRRGGRGDQGSSNRCFELIFDEFPDIVAVKDDCLFIIEVDIGFKQGYEDKLKKFLQRKAKLLECLEENLDVSIKHVEIGMAFQRKPKKKFQEIKIWVLNSEENKLINI